MPPTPEPVNTDLKVNTQPEILSLLRDIQDKGLMLTLVAPDGCNFAATLRSIEPDLASISFSAAANEPSLHRLLEADDVLAVAYLDRIKVQFQIDNLLLVTGPDGSALRADLPREMYRFQRRDSFRVRPVESGAPRATLSDPHHPGHTLRLRVLDVSMGGMAVFVAEDASPNADFPIGTLLGPVDLQLDRSTQLQVHLRVQHVSGFNQESKGVQLGCAFESLSGTASGILQRYIDHTQKRQRMLQRR